MACWTRHKGAQSSEDRYSRLSATANPLGILVDENLSPELADAAADRGFPSQAVARLWRLRGRGDHVIARHAVNGNMILITNNLVDFERIYQELKAHPGIVFFVCHSKLRKKAWQLKMMEIALDEIETEEPIQQAIVVRASPRGRNSATLSVDRYYLPDVAAENI